MPFTVTLSVAYDQPVTVSFRAANDTAGDGDYVAKTRTVTTEVKGASKREENETFYLDPYGRSINGLFTKNRGIGTILNGD